MTYMVRGGIKITLFGISFDADVICEYEVLGIPVLFSFGNLLIENFVIF